MADSLGELPPHLVEGIRLFRRGQYLEAHETLEEYWIKASREERDFYQGLIHLSTAFHHLSRGQLVGAKLQFAKADRRLGGYPDQYRCVPLGRIRRFLAGVGERIDAGAEINPPELELVGSPGAAAAAPPG